jgi:hypothetical protein
VSADGHIWEQRKAGWYKCVDEARTGIKTSTYHTRRSGTLLMYNHGYDLATLKVLLDHADCRQVQT